MLLVARLMGDGVRFTQSPFIVIDRFAYKAEF